MEHWLKTLIEFLYHFLKLNGLVLFYFDFDRRTAILATNSMYYSIAFILIFWSYLLYYVFTACALVIRKEKDLLIVFVLITDLITAYWKAFCMYVFQLIKRREIVESINWFIKFCALVFGRDCNFKSCFFDTKLTNSCKKKCWSVILQITLLITSLCTYEYNGSAYRVIDTILFVWISTLTTIVTSVFYWNSMMFSARFYQILDKKIKKLNQSINGSSIDDMIDQIYYLYEQIATFKSKVCEIYAFHIVTSLIGTVVWGTASVSGFIRFH